MTDIVTAMTATMNLGISVEKQLKDSSVSEVSLCPSEDVSKSPAIEIASIADESGQECANERGKESRATRSRARRLYHFLRIVAFTVYRQLLTLICIVNLIAILLVIASDSGLPLETAATAAVAKSDCRRFHPTRLHSEYPLQNLLECSTLRRSGFGGDLPRSIRMVECTAAELFLPSGGTLLSCPS